MFVLVGADHYSNAARTQCQNYRNSPDHSKKLVFFANIDAYSEVFIDREGV